MKVEDYILSNKQQGKKMLAVLLDPENITSPTDWAQRLADYPPDLIFIGGSTYFQSIGPLVDALRELSESRARVPILLFPGHPAQFSGREDAVLFLSLISGNNPDTLIGWHVGAARKIREAGTETIPVGYILVDGGKQSTTARVTHTEALPADDITRIVDTAIAGEMLGLRAIYLEAGSGASTPASQQLIRAVREAVSVPLIVGGGIQSPEQMHDAYRAGADIVVVGNHLEAHPEDLPRFLLHTETLKP